MNLSGQECAFLKSVKKKEIIRISSKAIELFLYLCPKFANVNLIIDQGNTTTKVALFCQDKLEYVMTVVKPDKQLVDTLLDKYRVTSCIYSSVVDVPFCFRCRLSYTCKNRIRDTDDIGTGQDCRGGRRFLWKTGLRYIDNRCRYGDYIWFIAETRSVYRRKYCSGYQDAVESIESF